MKRIHENRLEMLERMPRGATVAELGVLEGRFSDAILHKCAPRMFYMVDIFGGQVLSGDQDGKNIHPVDMGERMRLSLIARFKGLPVSIVMSDSISWLSSVPGGSLDWVYIDTTHEYVQTIFELTQSLCAVREGGWISGHDYAPEFPGVMQAVDEFTTSHGFHCEIWDGDGLPSYRFNTLPRSAISLGTKGAS